MCEEKAAVKEKEMLSSGRRRSNGTIETAHGIEGGDTNDCLLLENYASRHSAAESPCLAQVREDTQR